MKTVVLIIWLSSYQYGTAIQTHEFSSMESCMRAGTMIEEKAKEKRTLVPVWVCADNPLIP